MSVDVRGEVESGLGRLGRYEKFLGRDEYKVYRGRELIVVW